MLLREFEIDDIQYTTPKARLLVENLGFRQKFDFLKELDIFTEQECSAIKAFQIERNRLFHDSSKMDIISTFTSKEVENRSKDIYVAAFDAVAKADERRSIELAQRTTTYIEGSDYQVFNV